MSRLIPEEQAAREPFHVLLLDTERAVEERISGALAETQEGARLRLRRAVSVEDAIKTLRGGTMDVVLCPLPRDRRGLLPVIELRAAAPNVPVVVLASEADEPLAIKCVQLGAADYLILERLYGTLVARCLLHAIEVERVRSQLARHEAAWPPSLGPEGKGGGRAASLRSALPLDFAELVSDYGRVLDQAVEQIVYRVEHPIERSLLGLARRAGDLRAGPRDVVEIHAAAMKTKEREEGPQRFRLYVAEGRLCLLELMGDLVTYYRRMSFPARGVPTGKT